MRSSLGPSPLVRLLAQWAPADAEAPGMDFAERTSLWLGAFDAIRLQGVQQSLGPVPARTQRPSTQAAALRARALGDDLQRARAALVNAIAQDPLALALEPADAAPRYAPWQQRHLELQRQMAQMVGAVREHVRQAAARLSPRLRQLAALDEALEQVLAAREQQFLPTAVAVLRRRFEQLRTAHRDDDPALARRPGGWLDTFENDWRQALLAELDLRLQPVAGLVAAAGREWDLP